MLNLIKKEKLMLFNLDMLSTILYTAAVFISVLLLKVSKMNLRQFVVITQAVKGLTNIIASYVARIYEDRGSIPLCSTINFTVYNRSNLPSAEGRGFLVF